MLHFFVDTSFNSERRIEYGDNLPGFIRKDVVTEEGATFMLHNLLFDRDQTLLDFHASDHIASKMIMERNHQVFTEEHE